LFGFKTFEHDLFQLDEIETIEGEIRLYKTPFGNYPSMTSLLKQLDDGGITAWKERVGEEEAMRIQVESTTRGNKLHQLCEDYLMNKLIRTDITGQGGLLFNRAKGILDGITVVHGVEVPLYSTSGRYAGRTDGIVTINNKLTILDHKNSRRKIDFTKSYARKKIFEYMVQCTGYSRALCEMTGKFAEQGMLVISNMETLTSESITFPISIDLINELDILINGYYNAGNIKSSLYYSL